MFRSLEATNRGVKAYSRAVALVSCWVLLTFLGGSAWAEAKAAPATPAGKLVSKPVPLTPVQQQLKKIELLEGSLTKARTDWYEKARDIALLEQIISEAQLTLDLEVAPQGARLIFLEEYGPVLETTALRSLVEKDGNTIKGVSYNLTEITVIRDKGKELVTFYKQRQEGLKEEMKKDLDDIVAAANKLYTLKNAK